MTKDDDMQTVYDPFDARDVQISNRLVDRLRGKYAVGPHLPNGKPEFGWRQFEAPPIQHEAADKIEALEAEIERLRSRVEKLEARLEIDHIWKCQDDGPMQRVEIPADQRDDQIDGIECRDATIKLQDEELSHLRSLVAWKPIESAPDEAIVYDAANGQQRIAFRGTAIEDGSQAWVYARRLSGNPDHAIAFVVMKPTHWRPLGPPPQDTQKE